MGGGGGTDGGDGGPAEGQPAQPPEGREEITDARLGHLVQLLGTLPKYLRAMSLTIRSVYSTSTTFVEAFDILQKEFAKEAAVLKIFLLPLTSEVIIQLQHYLDHYLTNEFQMWQIKINNCAASAQEFQVLLHSLVDFYAHLSSDLARFPPLVKAVMEALVQETIKFQREAGVLGINSLIQDDVFISLLFVPVVDYYATPLVHGGERHDFHKPVVAKDMWESVVAAAMTVTGTLIPTVDKIGRLLRELEVFFGDVLADLMAMGAKPVTDEEEQAAMRKKPKTPQDPWKLLFAQEELAEEKKPQPSPEELAAREARQREHFNLFKPKAFWMQKQAAQMKALASNISSDLLLPCSDVPDPDPADYAIDWLENRTNSKGEDIIDVARAATRNVEILDAMDPA